MRNSALASLLTIGVAVVSLSAQPARSRPYLDAAIDAAKWIESSAIATTHGVTWPADPNDPNDPKSVGTTQRRGLGTILPGNPFD